MTKTKKVKAAGRYGIRYGRKVREKISDVESRQRKKQICPYCSKPALKRLSKGIWTCKKCKKKFASDTYYMSKRKK